MTSYLLTAYPWLIEKIRKHGVWCVYDTTMHLWFKVTLHGQTVGTTVLGPKYNG